MHGFRFVTRWNVVAVKGPFVLFLFLHGMAIFRTRNPTPPRYGCVETEIYEPGRAEGRQRAPGKMDQSKLAVMGTLGLATVGLYFAMVLSG